MQMDIPEMSIIVMMQKARTRLLVVTVNHFKAHLVRMDWDLTGKFEPFFGPSQNHFD